MSHNVSYSVSQCLAFLMPILSANIREPGNEASVSHVCFSHASCVSCNSHISCVSHVTLASVITN